MCAAWVRCKNHLRFLPTPAQPLYKLEGLPQERCTLTACSPPVWGICKPFQVSIPTAFPTPAWGLYRLQDQWRGRQLSADPIHGNLIKMKTCWGLYMMQKNLALSSSRTTRHMQSLSCAWKGTMSAVQQSSCVQQWKLQKPLDGLSLLYPTGFKSSKPRDRPLRAVTNSTIS